jgi:hypothetical protein
MSSAEEGLYLFRKITNGNLYSNLIEQLNKDFEFAGLPSSFSEEILPQEIRSHLTQLLIRLVSNDFPNYLNLLYRIDISEREIKKLEGSNIEIMCEAVALIVLQRECQKVWFRNKF